MPSINLDLLYFDHPKTGRLIRLLGKGSEVIPIRLWVHCGRHHPETGTLAGYSAQEIESEVAWWGQKGKAVEALVEVGFLDRIENGFQIHDWLDHCGHLVVYKERAKKASKQRWENARLDASRNASSSACTSTALDPPERGELEGGGKTESSRFSPPTVDEVRAYCVERKNSVDAAAFVDFYTSKGWMIGKNKMRSWQAAVRTWERNERDKPTKPSILDPIKQWMQQ